MHQIFILLLFNTKECPGAKCFSCTNRGVNIGIDKITSVHIQLLQEHIGTIYMMVGINWTLCMICRGKYTFHKWTNGALPYSNYTRCLNYHNLLTILNWRGRLGWHNDIKSVAIQSPELVILEPFLHSLSLKKFTWYFL